MKSVNSSSGIDRRVLLSTIALLPAFQPQAATAQQDATGCQLSFFICRIR